MCKDISWSAIYAARRGAQAKFGRVFQLPIARRVREVLATCITADARVLEIGAGDRHLAQWLARTKPHVSYRSLDIDPEGQHDYRDLADVTESLECVFALEVVEHLALEQVPPWLAQIRARLVPGGWLVLSTPNTYYPPAFLRDATHRTPWCYDELAGFVAASGLEVERIFRIYHDPIHRAFLRRYAFGWLFRLIGIDFARQIVLVARRPLTATGSENTARA